MEKTQVTFRNPETNNEIIIDFEYDKENSELNYNVSMTEGYEKQQQELTGFLAEMLLNALKLE